MPSTFLFLQQGLTIKCILGFTPNFKGIIQYSLQYSVQQIVHHSVQQKVLTAGKEVFLVDYVISASHFGVCIDCGVKDSEEYSVKYSVQYSVKYSVQYSVLCMVQ